MKKFRYIVLMIIFLATSLPLLADGLPRKDGKNKKKVKKTTLSKKVARKNTAKPSGPKTDADYLRAGLKRIEPSDTPPQISRVGIGYDVTCSENKVIMFRFALPSEFTSTSSIITRSDLTGYQKVSVHSQREFVVISKNIAYMLMVEYGVDVVYLREGSFVIERPNLIFDAKRFKKLLTDAMSPFELFEVVPPAACKTAA